MRFTILVLAALCFVPNAVLSAATIGDLAGSVNMTNLQNHVAALSGDRASVAGRNAARNYIATQLQGFGYTTSVDTKGNIVAELPGVTTPDEVYVVGAHFDAVAGSPGADDNASGVAGVLEIARVFSTRQFNSTIRFIGFDLEEVGLVGSTYYAQQAFANGDNIALAMIFDMIGYTSPTQGLVPTGDAGASGSFFVSENRLVGDFIGAMSHNNAALLDQYVAAGTQYGPGLPVVAGYFSATNVASPATQFLFGDLYRSDHVGFWLNGYDAMLIGDTANFRNPNYHGANDLLATLDFPFMTKVVRGSLGFVAEQAGLVPVPEPSTGLLLGVGLLGLAVAARQRSRKHR